MNMKSPYQEDQEAAKRTLRELEQAMKESGIQTIVVSYNGSGDSGYIENATQNEDDPNSEIGPESPLWSRIEDAMFATLTYNYPGWEINEGSKGTIVFSLNDEGAISARIRHEWLEYVEQEEIEGVPDDMSEDAAPSASP